MNRNSAALRRTDCALLSMLALRSQRRVCGRGLARRGLGRTVARLLGSKTTAPGLSSLGELPKWARDHVVECVEKPVTLTPSGARVHILGTAHLMRGVSQSVEDAVLEIGPNLTRICQEARLPQKDMDAIPSDWQQRAAEYSVADLRNRGLDERLAASLFMFHELYAAEFWSSELLARSRGLPITPAIDTAASDLPHKLQFFLQYNSSARHLCRSPLSYLLMAPSLPSILLQMLRLDRGVSAANSSLGQEVFDSGELSFLVENLFLSFFPQQTGLSAFQHTHQWWFARDIIMAARLQRYALESSRESSDARILAVVGKAHVRGIWDILDTQQDLSPLLSWRSHPRQAEDLFGALMRLRIPDYKNLSTPPTKKAAASEPAPEVFSTPPKAKAKKRGANRRRRAQEMMRARITSYSRP